jgi:FSR family fosmidomycin resistance protein-like MFS transporter
MRGKTSDDLINSENLIAKKIPNLPCPPPESDMNKRVLVLLSIGHFTVDMCQGVLPLLLPFLLVRMRLDYTATALIVTTSYLTSSIAQPLFGVLRHSLLSRWALPTGVFMACTFLALAGQMHSYPLLLMAVVLSSLGVALYHPEAAARANIAAGTVSKGRGMSAFALSGSLGFSTGALIFGPLLAGMGLHGALFLFIPALLVSLLLRLGLPLVSEVRQDAKPAHMGGGVTMAMTILISVIALRQWAMAGTMTFLPLYFTQHLHDPPVTASRMLFALQIGSDLGTLGCGVLGQRFGYKRVVILGLLCAAPFLLLYSHVTGFETPALLFFAGAMLAMPVLGTTMIGQEIMPHNKALAASLTLGFGVGLGGIASGFLGRVADVHGIGTALLLVGIAPLLGAAVGLALPTRMKPGMDSGPPPFR